MLKNCVFVIVCLASTRPIHALAASVGINDAVPQGRGLTDTSSSPFVKFRAVDIDAVKWMRGFWADRFTSCREVMVPNMWGLLSDPNVSHAYRNFRIAAGLEKGRHRGPSWSDGDLYKWLEAAASVYAVARDVELDRLMDEVVAVIEKAQREDGYIHTPVIIKQRLGDSQARPFQDRLDFEMYNLGHLMTAACIHHRATGKTTLLNIAKKACDYLDSVFEHPTPELAQNAVCPSHYMAVVEMYRTTRDRKYLELAKKFIDMRDLVAHGTDDNQDRIPLRQQTKAVGHAVRANYLYAGAADIYAETGDRSLLDALEKIWANVVFQKMYITGATGALYDGASPDGVKDQKSISRVHQAYGREYQLPNTTAHNETCANVANAMWNWRMLQISGDARFADVMELVIYNGALSGISLDGFVSRCTEAAFSTRSWQMARPLAVKRGSIVYCLESSDLPKDVMVSEIVIPRDVRLRPRFDPNLLGGVTVLEGQAQYRKQSDWTNILYRELPQGRPKAIDITLVPYYAWGNRGSSEMTVWMPVR